ncbi:mitogen-activated protein kinase kinase kinase 9-like [Tropilaelaps mercedesae]|uniref:mitogen-activated protein kinase kinase kinase n=1 Tax=Tropilaelaps mercedesae TaxID=418985 RepID=A0A1V9X1G1_9ACAR|nr:mitogen-activated protein kinase kinase kinase 9-like [Tropilaelaps mercedesae]
MASEDGPIAGTAAVQPRNPPGRINSARFFRILHDYKAAVDDELNLVRGEIGEVLSTNPEISGEEGWWIGKVNGKVGIFPLNFVTLERCVDDEAGPAGNGIGQQNLVADENIERINGSEEAESSNGENPGPPELDADEIVKGSPIGRGGFCKVYEGTYRNQKIAIKALEAQDPAVMLHAAKQEGGLIWTLRHKHIVKLFGVCLPNSWLIMEYCAGGPLNHVLEKNQVPLRTLTEWSLHIARGMQYIHSQRVIHRDLKSTNVLLAVPYRPDTKEAVQLKISDFGLARANVDRSTVFSVGGTFSWMAPENIRNNKYSQRSDVWSFGVLIWELLTGQIPYKGVDPVAIAYGIGSEKLKLPIPETCPEKFKNLMMDCWNTDPYRRPTFDKIITQLEDIFNSSCIVVLHESFHTMQERWRDEIAIMIEQIKVREEKLLSREEEIQKKERQLNLDRLAVDIREKLVRERESEVERRDRLARQAAETPPAPRRRHCKTKWKNVEISNPTGFTHNISWDSEHIEEHVAAFQASPKTAMPPVSPSLNLGRTRARTTSGSGSLSGSSQLSLHPSPTAPRGSLGSGSGIGSPNLLPTPFATSYGQCKQLLASQRSPGGPRGPIPGILHPNNSCSSSTSSPALNGNGHKGKTWSPSTIPTANLLQLQQQSSPNFQRVGHQLHDGDPMMIANPSAVSLQDQLRLDNFEGASSPSRALYENNKEKESRRKNYLGKTFCSMKNTFSNVLSAIGFKDRQSVTLQNSSHSRSYDELGHGEHMISEVPRAFDDTHLRGYARHNTYHGQMTQRNSGTRPSIFAGGQTNLWSPHAVLPHSQTNTGLPHSPMMARRRSSTTSHDSDQAYNSASSGFGPSPLGNAALTVTPQTSDYPFTPSSAEIVSSSLDAICSQQQHSQFTPISQQLPQSTYYGATQTVHSPYDARLTANTLTSVNAPRGSSTTTSGGLASVASPASSQCSSVFDNPGATPKSPPRTPQLYARNMSTPNANAYKIHGSPYTPRRKTSFPEVQHARQSNLDRPSTLNLNLTGGMRGAARSLAYNNHTLNARHAASTHQHPANSGTPTPDRTPPPELMELHLPAVAGSRQPLHYAGHYYNDYSPSSQLSNAAVTLRDEEILAGPRGWFHDHEPAPAPISPAPSTPPGGNTPQRKPTVRELEEDFSFSL